jgi:hypothetical protein
MRYPKVSQCVHAIFQNLKAIPKQKHFWFQAFSNKGYSPVFASALLFFKKESIKYIVEGLCRILPP